MFAILQKPQESVKAEDLETLQNEIERRLVEVVTQKWELERELIALDGTSPGADNNNFPLTSTDSSLPATVPPQSLSGKLRNSHRLNYNSENSSDPFRSSSALGQSSNGAGCSGLNSSDGSVCSEESLASSVTASTIITADLGSTYGANSAQTTSSLKRGLKGSSTERPSKRFRQNSSHSTTSNGPFSKQLPHSKHRSKIIPSKFRNSTDESRPKHKQLYKNEAPDKLWPFVEQFCATPTEEQIQELEEMIEAIDNDKEYYKIPVPIKKESPIKPELAGGKGQKKSKAKNGDEEPALGALTQRLVSSLIEESDDACGDTSKSSSESSSNQTAKKRKSRGNKSIDIKSAKNLEKRIRQELEEHEILSQQDDIPYTSEEDEILRQLVASQHELLSVQRQTKESLQRSLKRAKKFMELEKEREKLSEANAEVVAAYQRLIQARQKKRNPTKKERDAAIKALKIQDAIFKKCDELYLSGLSRNSI